MPGRRTPRRPAEPGRGGSPRHRVGFLAHQLAEYGTGAALIVAGAHLSGRQAWLLVALGSALFALAAASKGPLGAVRLLGRRLHHAIDVGLVAGLAAMPFVLLAWSRFDLAATVVAELVAALLLRIERGTDYAVPVAPAPGPALGGPLHQGAPDAAGNRARTARPGAAGAATRPSDAPTGTADAPTGMTPRLARRAGAALAATSAGAERLMPVAGGAARRAARGAGIVAGRARAARRRASRS